MLAEKIRTSELYFHIETQCLAEYSEVPDGNKCIFISSVTAVYSSALNDCKQRTNYTGGSLVEIRENATKNFLMNVPSPGISPLQLTATGSEKQIQ